MKKLHLVIAALIGFTAAHPAFAGEDKPPKFGDTRFLAYEGEHSWPTGDSAQVIKDYSVPIYIGLPTKKYKVLGRILDDRRSGLGIVGKAFDEGLSSEKGRQRDCANQARYRGADAVVVTHDEKIIKAFGLSSNDVHDTAPLFDYKDKIVVAIKFQ